MVVAQLGSSTKCPTMSCSLTWLAVAVACRWYGGVITLPDGRQYVTGGKSLLTLSSQPVTHLSMYVHVVSYPSAIHWQQRTAYLVLCFVLAVSCILHMQHIS